MSGTLIFLFILTGLFVVLLVAGIMWSIRSGQFEDLEGPAERILMDEDDPKLPGRKPFSREDQ
jgi:cbb3-type cytochrome oxidase maturation protein